MDHEQLRRFCKLDGQLQGFLEAMTTLSANAPDMAVQPYKLELLSSLLGELDDLLGDALRPFAEPVALPNTTTHSDAVVILGQHRACMDELRARHTTERYGHPHWVIKTKGKGEETTTEYLPVETSSAGST